MSTYPPFVDEKLAELVISSKMLSTAVNCLEGSSARDQISFESAAIRNGVEGLQAQLKLWGALPDTTPQTAPTLVLHDMQLYEIRQKDGMEYLHDGHFSRAGVDIQADTFPLTIKRYEITREFKEKLDRLFKQSTNAVSLNSEAIRRRALMYWVNVMNDPENQEILYRYTEEFTLFISEIEMHTSSIGNLLVQGVPVFNSNYVERVEPASMQAQDAELHH